ncbi:MAG TPA: hypothetical protein VF676_01480 [Flavobacterium sp.]|jgi:hypothetical protein
MKTIKLLLLLLMTSSMFISCSDDDPIQNQGNTESSVALRTALSELKKANGITNRIAASELCFEFVFPITFCYNNGTTVTVTSFEALLEILSAETPQFYIEGVVFPFEVVQQTGTGTVDMTINSENDFFNLLESCGINTIDDDLATTFCFDIVFPITIISGDGTEIGINNLTELEMYLNSPASGAGSDIVFPISVLYNGQVVIIHNLYELYEMISNCDECVCDAEYDPVCVQTAGGIVEYGNACHALCAGYTQNDFVDCTPTTECNISNFTVQIGECDSDGTYELTINFAYQNASSSQFEVRDGNNLLIGTYDLADLPLTISNYPNSGQGAEFAAVNIVGNSSCGAIQQWSVSCGGGSCTDMCGDILDPVCVMTGTGPVQFGNECLAACAGFSPADFIECGVSTDVFSSNLGSCFTIDYPVNVQFQEMIAEVTSDVQLVQFYTPAIQTMPAFDYPITVTFGSSVQTIESQTEFEALISAHCN